MKLTQKSIDLLDRVLNKTASLKEIDDVYVAIFSKTKVGFLGAGDIQRRFFFELVEHIRKHSYPMGAGYSICVKNINSIK